MTPHLCTGAPCVVCGREPGESERLIRFVTDDEPTVTGKHPPGSDGYEDGTG